MPAIMQTLQLDKQDLLEQISNLKNEVNELKQERDDLTMLLEMTTEHSDTVEEELHHKAEEALQESERRLRLIVEATPVPVLISYQASGEIVYANTMASLLMGIPIESLLGQNIASYYWEADNYQELLADFSETGKIDHYKIQLKKPDSSMLWVDTSLRALDFNDQLSILSTWHDITHLTQMNLASSRFVPTEWLAFLKKESIIDIELGDHISDEMTVMFSDLRSFTTISEDMTPRDNFRFVNSYLGKVSPVIREHKGFIVKYLGDGLMAIFPESADDAVLAGLEKLHQVNEYNAQRKKYGQLLLKVGIGVNTGNMMVGMVGEANRVQGDAFSDEVNLTSRVEGLTKFYNVSFIITEATYKNLADSSKYHIRFLDKVKVKGKQNSLNLYEVFDKDLPEVCELKQKTQVDFEKALEFYYQRDFAKAQSKLFNVLQQNPQDKVAWHHLMQATQYLERGVSESWTGATVMTQK